MNQRNNEIPARLAADVSVFLERGDIAAARAVLDQAMIDAPSQPTRELLGFVLLIGGDIEQAMGLYRQLVDSQPERADYWLNLGFCLSRMGKHQEAETAYLRATRLDPADAMAFANLGLLYWKNAEIGKAKAALGRAYELDPTLPEARIYGSLAFSAAGDIERAVLLLEGAKDWAFLGEEMESDLSLALVESGNMALAYDRLQKMMQAECRDSGLLKVRLAAVLERLNRLDEAQALLGQVAQKEKTSDELCSSVEAQLRYRISDFIESIAILEELVNRNKVASKKAHHWFNLAKAYDALGKFNEAIDAAKKGHEIVNGDLPAEIDIRAFDASSFIDSIGLGYHDVKATHDSGRSMQDADTPVFVVGFPRSGTTLLEQMLASLNGFISFDERPFLHGLGDHFSEFGMQYPEDIKMLQPEHAAKLRGIYFSQVSKLIPQRKDETVIDKNPLNFLRAPLISTIFHGAPILFVVRHPLDVIVSNYMQNYKSKAFNVMTSSISNLALSYVTTIKIWLRYQKARELNVLHVRYENLINDFESETARIANFVGAGDGKAMHGYAETARQRGFISTPSYSQVVEPLSRKAVGRWQRYREHLEPVIPLVKPIMDHWGYSAD